MAVGADENANRGKFYNYNSNNFVEVSANRNTNNAIPWKRRKDRRSTRGEGGGGGGRGGGRSTTSMLSGGSKEGAGEGGEEEEKRDGAEVSVASSSLSSSDSYRRMRGAGKPRFGGDVGAGGDAAGRGYGGSGSALNVKDFAKVNLQPRGY